MLGGSQEGGGQAESVCVVIRLFRGKLGTFKGMSAVGRNPHPAPCPLPPPPSPQVDDIRSSADVVFEKAFGISFFGSVFNL